MVQFLKVLHPIYIIFLLICVVWWWKILNALFSYSWFLHQVKILNRFKSQSSQILGILFCWWNLQITNLGEVRRKKNKESLRAYREGRWKPQYYKGSGCHRKDGALLVFHLTQMMLNEIGSELLSQHSSHRLPFAPHTFIINSLCSRVFFLVIFQGLQWSLIIISCCFPFSTSYWSTSP